MPLAGLARRLWQKGESAVPEASSGKDIRVTQTPMMGGQEDAADQAKGDAPRTEQRIEELEKQLAVTRQELNQWRDISGSHVVKRLLDQLAERDREVVRLRSELEIAVGGPVDSGVLEWSQSGLADEAQPSSPLQRQWPADSGNAGQGGELPSASERIGEPGDMQPQSSECTGSPASSERTLGPSGQEWASRGTVIGGASAAAQRAAASNASSGYPYGAHSPRDDVELRREGLEQWIEGTSSDSIPGRAAVPAVPVRAPPMPQAWGGVWGDERSARSTGDGTSITSDDNQSMARRMPGATDAGGADDGAGASNDGAQGSIKRTITPRSLALRRDAVEQLQEEIHGEIAKHREAYHIDGVPEKHSAAAQPEVAGADVEPEEMLIPSQSGLICQSSSMKQPGPFAQVSARSVLLSTASETSTVVPLDGGFEAATEASSEMTSTAISGDRRSPRGSPKGEQTFDDSDLLNYTYEDARMSMHGRPLEGGGGGDGDHDVQRQPTGGSLVSCSFFVSAEDDDGRKEMRRRRFERNQSERRSRAARDRASSNSSLAEQKRGAVGAERQSDADLSGSAQSPTRLSATNLPLAHIPKTAPEEERPSPSRAGAGSTSRGAHSRLHTERSRSPGQHPREAPPPAEGGHRFGPPMRVAAANAAAYAAAAAASALAAVSAVKQEQRSSQPSQRHRLTATAAAPPLAGSAPHATAARNRSSPRASPRPSPRPTRISPQNSPRVEEPRMRRFELNQGRTQSEAPPSRQSGGTPSASMPSATNMTALKSKFTELRDEMKRRRSKESAEDFQQEPESPTSRQPVVRTAAHAGEPRPEPSVNEAATGLPMSPSMGSVDRGRPVTAGATSERNAQSPAANQEQPRKHMLQQVPEQSRALQPILSRGGGNNSRSPRPGAGGSSGSGMHTRGRARAHPRDEAALGGGPGSFTGPPANPSAASNAPGGSSAQNSGLSRCSSARRRIGGDKSGGRRAVPPISGLLNLRSHGSSGGSHTAAPGSHLSSGDPERGSPPAPPATPAGNSHDRDRAGSLKAPLGTATASTAPMGAAALASAALAAAAAAAQTNAAAAAQTNAAMEAQKVPEQKEDGMEHIASIGSASALPTSNSAGVLPSVISATVAGNGSVTALSVGSGGSLQVGISGAAAQMLQSARHRRHSPTVNAQTQKLVSNALAAVAAVPAVASNAPQLSPGGSSGSASAAKGPASPRADPDSESDPVQEAVLQFAQHCANLRQPLVRIAPGVYLHGQKKLQLTLKQGRLMVRIGGGLVGLSETLLNSPALGGSGSSGLSITGLSSSAGSTIVQATPVGQPGTALGAASGFMTPGGTTTMSTPVATAVVAATSIQGMPNSSRQANVYHPLREMSTGPLPVRVVNSGLRTAL